MDDVSRIHIPENMVKFAENLDTVVVDTPVAGESVLDRQDTQNYFLKICYISFPSKFFAYSSESLLLCSVETDHLFGLDHPYRILTASWALSQALSISSFRA